MTLKEQTENIKDYFEKDHQRLDKIFVNFQELKTSEFEKAKDSFKEFMHGLQRHIIWEEDILFPIFEEKSKITSGGPTSVMRKEHREIKGYLEKIHDKIKIKDVNSFDEEKALLETLKVHNLKEENILYPAIDKLTNIDDRKTVFEKMKNIPEEQYLKCCDDS